MPDPEVVWGAVESTAWATLVMSILGMPGREGNKGKTKDSSGPSPQGAFCSHSEEHSHLSRVPGSWPQPPPGLPFPIIVGRRGAAGLREDIRCERGDDQGPDGLHSTALEAAGMGGPVPGSIPGCEMWAGHSAFLSCSVGSLRPHWGNNEPSIRQACEST